MTFFDREAPNYDQWYQSKLGLFVDQVETQLAFSMFKAKAGMKVLDVGCGTGNFSIKLGEMGCQVIGIDVSEEMMAIGREKVRERRLDISFRQMNVYDLEFENESFDAIFSMAAFEFFKEPQKAYDEMHRVLKKGGQLLIGTINKDSRWGQLYLTKEFQENTVFKYASLKTMDDLVSLNSKELICKGESLFIPPNAAETDLTMEKERELAATEKGGFICALWKKEE